MIRNILRFCFPVFFSIFIFHGPAGGQCFDTNFTFQAGEKITYYIVYNWHFIWLNAGRVGFEVKKTRYAGRDAYYFDAYGNTFKAYDLFFKVRDRFESYIDMKTLQPLWFERNTYEGGYAVHNCYIFDHSNKRILTFTENTNKPFLRDTLALPDCTFDVLSLTYFCRNMDFSGLKVNDTVPVSVIIDNELFNLYIRYLGREVIETREGDKFRCIKFSALLVEGTIFKGGEDLFVWVTDDKNRIPVLVEAKILVGSVKALLEDTKGLRYKITAKMK